MASPATRAERSSTGSTASEPTPDRRWASAVRRSAAIVGITYRQLDYWARTDLVRPSVRRRAGERHAAPATRTATSCELKVMKSLLDAGVTLQIGAQGDRVPARRPRRRLGDRAASCSTARSSVLARDRRRSSSTCSRTGQGVLNIVPLGPVVERARRAAARARADAAGDGAGGAPVERGRARRG